MQVIRMPPGVLPDLNGLYTFVEVLDFEDAEKEAKKQANGVQCWYFESTIVTQAYLIIPVTLYGGYSD